MKRFSFASIFIILLLILNCGGGGSKSSENQRFNGENNEIIAFCFSSQKNSTQGITTDVIGQISNNSITLEVPHNALLAGLVAEFVSNSKEIKVNDVVQKSGVTANNFTGRVTYSAFADDGTKRDYTITVTKALNSEKKITAFSICSIPGTIDENAGTISVVLPPHTDIGSTAASFSFIGKSITVNGVSQQSGVTQNNFTGQVIYTITADNGSSRTYTITATVEKDSQKEILNFAFLRSENTGLVSDVTGIINGTDIQLTLPFGSERTNLIASFITNGVSVKIGEAEQVSGNTSNDFTDTKTYTVTAENGSTKDYTVAVSVAKSDAKEITVFSLDGETGIIDEQNRTITIQFQASKDITNLIACFVTTGVHVTANGTEQESGTTMNDFSGPVIYTVAADNGTTRDYTVNAVKSGEITGLWNFEYGAEGSTVNGTTGTQGVTGNALQFNGLTDYVYTPDSDSLTLASGGTIEVVLKAFEHRPFAGIVHKGVLSDFSDETYSFQFWGANNGTDGTLFFLVHNTAQNASQYTSVESATKLELNKWYHLIAVWDTTHLALYINGSKDAEIVTDVGQVKDSDGGLIIGAQLDHTYYTPWGNLGFNGIIDRVQILNRALSDSEANAYYQQFVNIAGTGFTAYLLSVAKRNMPYIVIIFAVIVLALAVIYAYNRKHSKAAS